MNVSGKVTVFRKDFEGRPAYSFSISEKKEDGTYDRAYMNIKFKKGVELESKTEINITNGWLKQWGGKIYVFVNEFEGGIPQGFKEVAPEDDDYLPFA